MDDIQWIRVEDTPEEFDVNEYEKKLHADAEETMNLLSDLCHRTDVLVEQQREALCKWASQLLWLPFYLIPPPMFCRTTLITVHKVPVKYVIQVKMMIKIDQLIF